VLDEVGGAYAVLSAEVFKAGVWEAAGVSLFDDCFFCTVACPNRYLFNVIDLSTRTTERSSTEHAPPAQGSLSALAAPACCSQHRETAATASLDANFNAAAARLSHCRRCRRLRHVARAAPTAAVLLPPPPLVPPSYPPPPTPA